MEKLLFPNLNGKWKSDIKLEKYADLIRFDGGFVSLHNMLGVDYSWGGYLENRESMLSYTYLPSGGRYHLGIDYWVSEGVAVHLPKEGKLIYSGSNGDQDGGWGGKVIFKINELYYIFGHLKNIVVEIGRVYSQGEVLGYIAEREYNGGWYPHLHVQCMRNLDVDVDGYSSWRDNLGSDFPNPMEAIML